MLRFHVEELAEHEIEITVHEDRELVARVICADTLAAAAEALTTAAGVAEAFAMAAS